MAQYRYKKILKVLVLPVLLFATYGLSACTSSTSQSSSEAIPSFSVALQEDAEHFTVVSANPVSVKRGKAATFDILLAENYSLDYLTRDGEKIEYTSSLIDDVTTQITVYDIRFSQTIVAHCFETSAKISFYPNGGTYLDGSDASKPFTVGHALKSRLRPNTSIGTDTIEREGYFLRGWNTEADGSGIDVGLGSRVTLEHNSTLPLYAVWEKENPVTDFTYTKTSSDTITINGYSGGSKAVVPAKIEGLPVTAIAPNAFTGEEEYVYLPYTMKTVVKGAFNGSKLKELWFYDDITTISDACFVDCSDFAHVHLNAIQPPRFGSKVLYSEINFADKYDLLILNAEKKKMVSFGGSGAYISIDTKRFEKAFNDGTVCLNMAVNGWFNAIAQIEMMMPYLNEGDIFFAAPEPSSQFGLFYGDTMFPSIGSFQYNAIRLYACLESNYDLMSSIDIRHVSEFFDGYAYYNSVRTKYEPTTYNDFKTEIHLYSDLYNRDMAYIDDRGNWALDRRQGKAQNDSGEADAVVEYLQSPKAKERTSYYLNLFESKGVKVFYSTAPLNQDVLQKRLDKPELFNTTNPGKYLYFGRPAEIPDPDYPDVSTWLDEFDAAMRENFGDHLITSIKDLLFHTEDYFEPDYHLCDAMVPVYTDALIEAMFNALAKESA